MSAAEQIAAAAASAVASVVKLLADRPEEARELKDWVHGDGARPKFLDLESVPDVTRNVLASARAHERARKAQERAEAAKKS